MQSIVTTSKLVIKNNSPPGTQENLQTFLPIRQLTLLLKTETKQNIRKVIKLYK